VVEHDMSFVHDLCDRTVVLNFGRLIYDGPTQGVQENAQVREAYLGSRRVATRVANRVA
jgi:branched-chain amino acid transport system ATP-binding protein